MDPSFNVSKKKKRGPINILFYSMDSTNHWLSVAFKLHVFIYIYKFSFWSREILMDFLWEDKLKPQNLWSLTLDCNYWKETCITFPPNPYWSSWDSLLASQDTKWQVCNGLCHSEQPKKHYLLVLSCTSDNTLHHQVEKRQHNFSRLIPS